MSDIIDEVNQELRADRGRALWKKYGVYVIGVVVFIIVGIVGYQGYVAYDDRARTAAANSYLSALDNFASGDSAALEAIASQSGEGYPMLARFMLAGDDTSEAAYLALADDSRLDDIYRQAATLLSVLNAASGTSVDEKSRRLVPLATFDGPWRLLAMEVLIALEIESGDIAGAKARLQELRALPALPVGLNRRLALLDAALEG